MAETRWVAVAEGVKTFEHPKPFQTLGLTLEEALAVIPVASALNCVTSLEGRWPRLAGRLCDCGAYRLVVTEGVST